MYVINPAPGPQDLQPTVSSYASAEVVGAATHRPECPTESVEQQQQQQKQRNRKELLSRILTKCTFDMSEEVATFSSPGEKTPPRTAAAATATEAGNSSTPPTAEATSPLRPEADGSEQQNGPADVAGISPPVTVNGSGADAAVRGTPSPGSLRAVSPDRSPVRSTASSSNTSLSPSSLAESAKPSGACEATEGDQPLSAKPTAVSNFASVVHPKERALKSIAAEAAAAAAAAAAVAAVAVSAPTSDRNSSSSTNGADGKVKPPVAGGLMVASSGGRALLNGANCTPGAAAPGNIGAGTGTAVHGGRLQFFKDGKFILELARAKEGEKTSWISVPRKTYWPPTVSSTSANFHKHESSTSLSFSDDNSSIQSSPWQRDHCWKQANPRANISKELALYYFRPPNVRFRLARDTRARLRRKRRRPYEATMPSDVKQNEAGPLLPFDLEERRARHLRSDPTTSTTAKGKEVSSEGPSQGGGSKKSTEDDGCNGETPMDTSEPTPPAAPSEGEEAERQDATSKPSKSRKKPPARATEGKKDTNSKPRNGHHHPLTNGHLHPHGPREDGGRGRCKRPEGKDLAAIVLALSEQQQQRVVTAASLAPVFRLGAIAGGNGTVRNAVFGSGSAAQHVSPRKRILRELEKVSLEDGGSGGSTMKRSRPKSGTGGGGSAASTPVIVTATTATPLSTLPTNGAGSAINGSSSNNAGSSSGSSNNTSRTNGHVNGAGSGSNGTVGAGGKHLSNGVGSRSPVAAPSTPAPPAAPISRPFSSYSITSLLGHTTTQSNESSSSEAATAGAAHRKPDHNSSTSHSGSVASVTSTASHYHHQHQQQLHAHLNQHHHPLSPHQQQYQQHHQQQLLTSSPKSPTMMDPHHQHPLLQHGYPQPPYHHGSSRYHSAGSKKRSPNYGNGGSPGAMEHGGIPYGGGAIRSPDLSPSPEHHHQHQSHHAPAAPQQQQHHHPAHHTGSGFTRYRQHPYGGSPGSSSYSSAQSSSARFSPSPSTNDSTTPPYVRSSSSSYRAAYLAANSSGSPPAANGSPQHYSRASPLNFGRGALLSSPPPSSGSAHHQQQQHQQNLRGGNTSPRASPTSTGSSSGSHGNSVVTATTPTSAMAALTTGSSSSPSNVRTVPKKTAALRQPFASGGHSPSRERSHSNASSSSSSLSVKKELQLLSDSTGSAATIDSVDGPVSLSSAAMHYGPGMPASSGASGVIRPSTVIASPSPHHHHHHPVAANPFYSLYPPQLAASLLSAGHGVPPPPSGSSAANSPANAAVLAAAAFHPAAAAAASLTSYYQQMYSAATMAAAYRNPLWMHYPGLAAVAPQGPGHHMIAPPPPSAAAAVAMIGSSEGRRMDHRNHATASPPPQSTPLSQEIPPSTSSPPIHVDNRPSEQHQHQHHQSLHSSQSIPAISTAAALNYSVTALTSTPSSSSSVRGNWVGGEGGGYTQHDHSIAAPAAKEDPSNDLPLNLSKH